MMQSVLPQLHAIAWRLIRRAHQFDFKFLLPGIARLPLGLAYALSYLRGKLNAATGRDWRSVALGFRHIRRQSMAGYQLLPLQGSNRQLASWRNKRFEVEAREEFEARLVVERRLPRLSCNYSPSGAEIVCNDRNKGLLLLTLHFESFFLGAAFLARAGATINFMSSSITHDPRVAPAVQNHFETKYRGLEHYLNGGAIVDMEDGLRPFYRMLERHETLIVMGDSPMLPNGVGMTVDFLGQYRQLAGGALRLAQRTGSDLGAYLCYHRGGGSYALDLCPIGPADDPKTIENVYRFFTQAILANPGHWWGSDLLPAMPPVPSPPKAESPV